jgi:murein DD-endopeptidase MepM/ murein hydrolase activator NlpD
VDASGPWTNPLGEAPYRISDTYGWEYSAARGGYALHDGTDLSAPTGTPVFAAHDGIVWQAKLGGASGNQLIVDTGGEFGTGFGYKYEHLDHFAPGVIPGQPVTVGQLVGYVGATGNASGPHLHYSDCNEISQCQYGSGAPESATRDPQPFMAEQGAPL